MNRYDPETKRLDFLLERDGLGETLKFAIRTMKSYRRAVLNDVGRERKRTFIESYLAFKRFIADFDEK